MPGFFEVMESLKPKTEVAKTSGYIEPPPLLTGPKDKMESNAKLFNNGKIRLFTYGTLKRRNSRHNFLSHTTFVCEAYMDPQYKLKQTDSSPGLMYPASGFPVALPKSMGDLKDTRIKGEIYEINAADLRRIDSIENIGTMYTRERVSAYRIINEQGDRELYQCYAYIGIPNYWDSTRLYLCPTYEKPIHHYVFNPYAETTNSVPDVG